MIQNGKIQDVNINIMFKSDFCVNAVVNILRIHFASQTKQKSWVINLQISGSFNTRSVLSPLPESLSVRLSVLWLARWMVEYLSQPLCACLSVFHSYSLQFIDAAVKSVCVSTNQS